MGVEAWHIIENKKMATDKPYEEIISKYNLDELLGVKNHIDATSHPDRYELLLREIKKRENGIGPVAVAIGINKSSFGYYRAVRLVFWATALSSLACFPLGKPGLGGFLFIVAFTVSIISIFTPCPVCGKTVGFRKWEILVAGNALGGWCLHCGSRLFLRTRSNNKRP